MIEMISIFAKHSALQKTVQHPGNVTKVRWGGTRQGVNFKNFGH